jgi:hypothetical protein
VGLFLRGGPSRDCDLGLLKNLELRPVGGLRDYKLRKKTIMICICGTNLGCINSIDPNNE